MSNEQKIINRKSKDSVFVKLFQDKNNVLQLYEELHPEMKNICVDDIEIQTLESIIVNTQYNDLGFTVKDKFIQLFEAQSTWNKNMPIRMLMYISETFKRYIESTNQSVHQSKKLELPIPEMYVIYSGESNHSEIISLNEEFFDGKSSIDLKIKILTKTDNTIAGQYIGFCKVFDENRKKIENPIEVAKETYRICIERGYLADFMKAHESEVIDMMSELFDEEYLRKQYNKAEKKINIEAGKQEKEAELIEKWKNKGYTDEQIKELLS